MKKFFPLVVILFTLAACSQTPVDVSQTGSVVTVDSGTVVSTGATGSGYDDKEVAEAMKEIDDIFSDLTNSGAKK